MDLESLKKAVRKILKEVKAADDLESVRLKLLGRKSGLLTQALGSLKNLSLEEKRKQGPVLNALREEAEKSLEAQRVAFSTSGRDRRLDLTLPGKKVELGHYHPLTLVEQEIREIFRALNFSVVEGPEVESEYYNFDALNIPPDHPARDMWDTFWLNQSASGLVARPDSQRKSGLGPDSGRLLLRTHTSPVQIRYMQKHQPPFQIIVPGRVFRYEATDASHEINFHQVEGLMVGKDVSLANFKFVIEEFFKRLFRKSVAVRLRPSYFPFVEPGLEVDVQCVKCGGRGLISHSGTADPAKRGLGLIPHSGTADPAKRGLGLIPHSGTADQTESGLGCNVCKESGWLEVMGAGMVHRRVFEAAGYNPEDWQGFAFGLGLERIAMIKYNIPDIRLFYSGDLRFINQF